MVSTETEPSSHIRRGSWEAKIPWRCLHTEPLTWPEGEDMRPVQKPAVVLRITEGCCHCLLSALTHLTSSVYRTEAERPVCTN